MATKNFPFVKLHSTSTKGHYYGAYESEEETAKLGYMIFISTDGRPNTCECMGYVHGNNCYHVDEALKKESVLFG